MQAFDSDQHATFLGHLRSAADALDLKPSDKQFDQLLLYLGLLNKWNRTYNLTAVRGPEQMLWRHLVDSMSIVPYVTGEKILDVGTGPGLPGIPLAIFYPEKQFSLLDSNVKKTRFLTQSVIELGLSNVTVFHTRVEELSIDQPYDQIMSRAFSALDKMVELCHPFLSNSGQFIAMKGLVIEEEIQALNSAFEQRFQITEMVKLQVPGCDGQRHLIIIEPSSS